VAPGFDVLPWYCLFSPVKPPDAIVRRVNPALHKVPSNKASVDRFTALGFDIPAAHSPADFTQFLARESAKWQKVIAQAGIKGE